MPHLFAFILLTTIAGLGDPFASAHVGANENLKLGLEHNYWGYYTEGLADYVGAVQNPADWDPVMRLPDDNYSEHPFVAIEWNYFYGTSEYYPNDYYAAHLAELFSVDIFPTDPSKNHRLVAHDLSWRADAEPYLSELNPIFETVSELLNDPGGDGMAFDAYVYYPVPQPEPPYTIVKIHKYSYYPRGNYTFDEVVHFIRTDCGVSDVTNQYLHRPYDLDLFEGDWPPPPPLWPAWYDSASRDLLTIDCLTPVGNSFQKPDVDPAHVSVPFGPGELGPAMLILDDVAPTNEEETVDQSLQLHSGWNLVSWHIEPLNPPIFMWQILPYEGLPPPYYYADWFHENGGKLHIYTDADPEHYYYNNPGYTQSAQWVWNLNHAYYISLDITHPWLVENRERFGTPEFDVEPDPAWDDLDPFTPDYYTNGWFFMGYAAPGYCKLSTIYDNPHVPSGDPDDCQYLGPFHRMIWEEANNWAHYPLEEQYLSIVKTDDGKFYIPYDNDGPLHGREIDQIGVLEPGRGYFLGFRQSSGTNAGMVNFSWDGYPGWPTQGLPPIPGESSRGTASANHFQYHPFTHWSYPVIIDTVDLAATPMALGDQIGIFDGELCVGAAAYPDSFPVLITCWKDDIATPDTVDGYAAGNEMTFVWYDASENQEVTFQLPPGIESVADDPIAPTHSGFGAGVYAVRSMIYGAQSITQLPQAYRLGQNFPNPFNAETLIPLELPQRSRVVLELFNVKGQRLGVLFDGIKEAGWEKVRYKAAALPSGIYFLRVTAQGLERGGKFVDVGKMLVLK